MSSKGEFGQALPVRRDEVRIGLIHMNADEHLLLQPPPQPEKTELPPHPRRRRLDTAALLVAVVSLTWTGWQSWETSKARLASERSAKAAEDSASEARRMNELTKGSLEVAQSAAAAAYQSAAAADKQAQAALEQNALSATGNRLTAESLRARITVRGVTLRQRPVAGQPLTADVYVENTGHSEAVNVQVRMTATQGGVLPSGSMPSIPAPVGGSSGVLGPGKSMSSDLVIHKTSLTPQMVEALLSGSAKLFVFGVVTYDTFGSSHQTEFCFVPSPIDIQNAEMCTKWNDTR